MGECNPSSEIEVDPDELEYWTDQCGGTFTKVDNQDNAYITLNATDDDFFWWGSGGLWRCTDRLPTCDGSQYAVYIVLDNAALDNATSCGMFSSTGQYLIFRIIFCFYMIYSNTRRTGMQWNR